MLDEQALKTVEYDAVMCLTLTHMIITIHCQMCSWSLSISSQCHAVAKERVPAGAQPVFCASLSKRDFIHQAERRAERCCLAPHEL